MWLIFGLGNPGAEYLFTRHNFGFMVLDTFASAHGLKFKYDKISNSEYAKFKDLAILIKPLTFMNSSGFSVKAWVKREKSPVEKVFVIHDDLDLPLGRLKIVPKGGAGGHKGVKSVIESLGTKDFPRMKLGIGRPQRQSIVDYVLSPFSKEELQVVKKVLEVASFAIEDLFSLGLDRVMTKYNSMECL